jgi:hypothetical protein
VRSCLQLSQRPLSIKTPEIVGKRKHLIAYEYHQHLGSRSMNTIKNLPDYSPWEDHDVIDHITPPQPEVISAEASLTEVFMWDIS